MLPMSTRYLSNVFALKRIGSIKTIKILQMVIHVYIYIYGYIRGTCLMNGEMASSQCDIIICFQFYNRKIED